MPVPNAMSDLSQLPGSNYPVGSEAIGNNLDNYLRAHAALIRQSNALASSTMPSGSTVNVALSDGESVSITGDASISSLGTGFNGCKRELRFTGAATLVHSSSLQLPGAANFTTAAGHVHTFRCIGANTWVLVASALPPRFLNQWGAIDPATIQPALGYTPVEQGGGVAQTTAKVHLGWDGTGLRAQANGADLGRLATNSFLSANYVGNTGAQSMQGPLTVTSTAQFAIQAQSRIRTYGSTAGLSIQNQSGGFDWEVYSSGAVLRFYDGSADRILISGAGMNINGYLEATGDVGGLSDRRVKDDIRTIENAMGIVRRLRGTTYTKDGARKYGVIAQEIEEVMSEIVRDGEDGLKRVACGNEIPSVLIEAVKFLDERMSRAGI